MRGDPYDPTDAASTTAVLHRLASVLKEDAEWVFSALDKDIDEVVSVLRSGAEWVLQSLDHHAPEWDADLGPRSRRVFRMMVLFSILGNRDRDLLLAFATRLAQGKALASEANGAGTLSKRVTRTSARPSHATGLAGSATISLTGGPRVLLVDDDPDSLRVTRAMLRKSGFAVTSAATGDEALARIGAEAPFDVLVTDYAMPGLNGLGLVELAHEREPELPVLVVTGYGDDIVPRRLPPGVEVLTKPFTRSEFVERIQSLTRARWDMAGTVSATNGSPRA